VVVLWRWSDLHAAVKRGLNIAIPWFSDICSEEEDN
jgi:hypothetical protein